MTVQGLIRKRAELAGEVEALNANITAHMAALNSIDASIRVFRPDIDLGDLPERVAVAPFTGFRGEIQRFLLDELRKANAPQSTFDLADKIMERRGLDATDKIVVSLIRKRTGYALAKLRKAGKAVSRARGKGAPLSWMLSEVS